MKLWIKSFTKNPVMEYKIPANIILPPTNKINSNEIISITFNLLDPIVNMV